MPSRTLWRIVVAVAVLAIVAIYALRIDTAAGLLVDDAWYIVLAKALAEGNGYALISSAATAILPAVPPGFPFILSLVFRIAGGFPENVVLLKAVSIAAMAILGLIGYRYLTRDERVPAPAALLIVTATMITPALVFLTTSTIMAEAVFAATQVCAVFWIERTIRGDRYARASPVIAGALSAAAMLVRTAALALVVAGVLRCCVERRWRQAAVYAGIVMVCLAPWQWYAYQHAPTHEQSVEHGGSIAFSYGALLSMNRGGDLTRGQATAQDLSGRIGRNLQAVLLRDLGAVLAPALYRGPAESGQEVVGVPVVSGTIPSMGAATGTKVVSCLLAMVILVGWYLSARQRLSTAVLLLPLTLGMILLVPDQTFRYSLPITLFLILFLWRGLSGIGGMVNESTGQSVPRIAIAGLLGLNLLDHGQYIFMKQQGTAPEWIADSREADEVLTWMSAHLNAPGSVASTNPGLIYLRTGRLSVSTNDFEANWARWSAAGVRYVVALRRLELPPAGLGYRVWYRTERSKLWVIEICSVTIPASCT